MPPPPSGGSDGGGDAGALGALGAGEGGDGEAIRVVTSLTSCKLTLSEKEKTVRLELSDWRVPLTEVASAATAVWIETATSSSK